MSSKTAELDKTVVEEKADRGVPLTPGKTLRDERERLNLSKEDIAMRLRLRVGVIEAIERDDYREMVADVFLKGYLRSYAKLLSLDPDGLIKQFESLDIEALPAPSSPQLWQNFKPHEKKERPFRVMALLSAGFGLLLVMAWLTNAVMFHPSNEAVEQDSMTMNVLGTKKLAQTDLSKLETNKKDPVINTVKKPASSRAKTTKKV